MDTRLSYVILSAVTFTAPDATGSHQYDFTIKLTTNLSGLIRTDSILQFEITGSNGSTYTTSTQCYQDGVLITSKELTGLLLPNNDGDNTISDMTLEFDYLDAVWRTINFTYGGSMSERIQYINIVS